MATESPTHAAVRLGWYTAIATVILTLVTFAIAITTLPRSGPNCVGECFTYPYTNITARFPRDYLWMYPAMALTLVFYTLMACVHQVAGTSKQIYSRIGLSFALIATAVLLLDYFVQVSVIQPSLVKGETEGLALLTQFNPHGLFIVLEEIGYTLMSLAVLCLAPAISGATRVDRWIRWIFIGSFVLTVIALIGYSLAYGINREDRFEVATISANWLAWLAGSALLAVKFRRTLRLT